MCLFNFLKKDEYDEIYGESDNNLDNAIEELKGTISSGKCILCGAENGMKYEGDVCFICSKCGGSVHEDTYYAWASGYDIEFED